ncbi:MAG: hypothetical protein HN597_03550 [Desulfobacula sp.]|jgi:hypothetical protein|uniref:Uncharacterized protein n=1 Tax=uncultured marine virus TaxID=186617 RepID=A0A0F7L687_9VIRU|nr:hypothetical protein [uncultured marine virus]MBT7628765.1 hypothetical protein [Desulfobacula sp.]
MNILMTMIAGMIIYCSYKTYVLAVNGQPEEIGTVVFNIGLIIIGIIVIGILFIARRYYD